jgi:hypothetical protein
MSENSPWEFLGTDVLPETNIDPFRRRIIMHEVLGLNGCESMSGGQCLIAWLYAHLLQLPWLVPEAALEIIRDSKEDMLDHGDTLKEGLNKNYPAANVRSVTLAFAERHYVTWTGLTGYLYLPTCTRMPKLPVTPLESIGYNLTELFRRNFFRCRDRYARSRTNPDLPGVPGSLDRP